MTNRYNILTNESDTNATEKCDLTNVLHRHKPIKRGFNMKQHVKRQNAASLKMFSANGAGIVWGKKKSLVSLVKSTCSNLVTLQETHCRRVKFRSQIWWFLRPFAVLKVGAHWWHATRT